MMRVIKYYLTTAALLLTACTTPAPIAPVSRYPQAVDMQPCPPLDKPDNGSLASLYRYGVSAAHRYHDCSAHHDNLIDWVKRGEATPH
ncbi:MAG: hypothetical protein ACYC1F_01100 [Gallionellaceae bacterium]